MISFSSDGSFQNTERFLNRMSRGDILALLARYGALGVKILSDATPVDTGKTASSWYYEVKRERDAFTITWGNTNIVSGRPIALLLQYGHGTRNGGYVRGIDYINPALRPIFDKIAEEAWKEVTSA